MSKLCLQLFSLKGMLETAKKWDGIMSFNCKEER